MEEVSIKESGSTTLGRYVCLKMDGWLDGIPVCQITGMRSDFLQSFPCIIQNICSQFSGSETGVGGVYFDFNGVAFYYLYQHVKHPQAPLVAISFYVAFSQLWAVELLRSFHHESP